METTKKIRRTKRAADKKTPAASIGHKKLKLLVTVVGRNKTEFYLDFLSQFDANFQFAALAQGTAKSETLYLLGLEDSEKSVIFSVIQEEKAGEILQALDDKFHAIKNGKGIAFTVPMSSVVGVAVYRFLSNHRS